MANYINMVTVLLSLFTIFFFISTEFLTLSDATSNETDLQALLDFKNHIQSDPSHFLNSWNDSLHFCNWQGITCGKRHQRVTVLDVSSLDLVGTLSPSIGNLSFLREISLSGNSFQGIIPQEIGRLFRLQSLFLLHNSFQGQLPANISLCKNLQFIDLFGNNLSGRIPHQLGALSNLYYLGLGKNNFIGNIPSSLGNISTLNKLNIITNYLSGNIPRELGKLYNLQELDLGLNKLSGSFPTEIYNISTIQVLSITENFLTGQFPHTLGLTLPKMTKFEVGFNNFTGSIPSTLANASSLAIIDIGHNMLTGPIPRNLGRLQQLHDLILDLNPLGIDKDNDISFIGTLTNCTNLEILSLGQIGIGGVMPLEISNMSRKLTYLILNDNHISGNLPEEIGELNGLNCFVVGGNTLSGNIPLSIGKLINLKQLYLDDNNFIGEIPPSIGDISGLLVLLLSRNMLTGSIPVSLSNLTELEGLDLQQNHLNGTLPKEVFSLTSLSQGLFLQRNKFTGSLPSEVGNLKRLVSLCVAENELSGEIPISIGNCQMLGTLLMEGNLLDGTIPSSLGQLKSIDFMDLSRNKLSGKIPTSLETLKLISFLNLSFNMLEGEVPRNGVFANASALSIVGNGKLCGGIKSLNLHDCPPNDSKKHRKLSTRIIIILVICILITLASLSGCTYAIYQTRKSKRVPSSTSAHDKKLLQISYAEILTSTNGFSSENLIGEGKYGSVYRGVIKPGEKIVAIKVLKLQLKGAHKSFLAECEALRNIRHRNLAKIITSCSSIDFKGNDFKALVLEYVSNGSLEGWLHQNPSNERKLGLLERLNIAIDIATAMDYLHNHSGNPIVHCDIKPSNVLLGDDLCGLVSDFGLAKFLPVANDISHDIESTSIGISGTIGYVAPEYATAMDYLHNHSGNPIVHCDIKPSNVLLGDDLRGLVSDFGLAKFLPTTNDISHDIESTSMGIRGTIGYVAPEYGMGGDVSAKGDIYSFGILLLEMFTGKRPTDTIFTEDFNLHNYVKTALDHRVAEIVDPQLLTVDNDEENRSNHNSTRIESCCLSIFRVGVSCSYEMQNERMDISNALNELQHIRNKM